jgi:hypothetical protein
MSSSKIDSAAFLRIKKLLEKLDITIFTPSALKPRQNTAADVIIISTPNRIGESPLLSIIKNKERNKDKLSTFTIDYSDLTKI